MAGREGVRWCKAFNVMTCRPRKNHLVLGVRLPETDELTARTEAIGLETLPYDRAESAYRFRLTARELAAKRDPLAALIALTVEERGG
jgi:hypothetical protein